MWQSYLLAFVWLASCSFLLSEKSLADDASGVLVRFEKYDGPATIVTESVDQYRLRIDVDPKMEREPLAIRVELPTSGRNAWCAADVEVRNVRGRPLAVRRSGIEWHKLLIPVPTVRDTYFVQAVAPPGGRSPLPAEEERNLVDRATGLSVTIARWRDGRRAALSIRFDDSHPTHLSTAIPILRQYGFRGTFMVNPGGREPHSRRRSDFEEHLAEWEAVARRGDQEFANHSAHHRGGIGDEDVEAEIGEAAKAIWRLSPGKSPLMALNLGGGTLWETTRPLSYYLDKYHLFDASGNSTGMDDTYGNRVANFRRMLEQHIERGLWYRIHYHYIGEGLSSSEANFRAVLDIAKEHEAALWIAGMADIHKYQTERNGARLTVVRSEPRYLTFRLSCLTDPELYDQPLTIEVAPPTSWPPSRLAVTSLQGKANGIRTVQAHGKAVMRFEAAPRTTDYTIELIP
jgi:hypothetical protein